MRGLIGAIVIIGLLVMLYTGRVTEWAGGGVVIPRVQVSFSKDEKSKATVVEIRNTGTEPLTDLSLARSRWNWDEKIPLGLHLDPGETLRKPLPTSVDGDYIYVFARGYWLPASVSVK